MRGGEGGSVSKTRRRRAAQAGIARTPHQSSSRRLPGMWGQIRVGRVTPELWVSCALVGEGGRREGSRRHAGRGDAGVV